MKFTVGLFVIGLIISTLSLTFFLLYKKGVFDQRYTYTFKTTSAQSLSIGMPLLLSGFEIGRIDNISLTHTGLVDITFSVNERNREWITQNTKLTLKKPLLGSPYIDITSNHELPLLEPGSIVSMTVSDDINDIINKLDPTIQQLSTIIADLAILTAEFSKPDGALLATMKNIEAISTKLNESPSLLGSVTGNPDDGNTLSSTLNESKKTILKLQKTIDLTNELVAGMNEAIVQPANQILLQMQEIMQDVSGKLQALDNTVNAIGSSDKEILILKQQLLESVEKTNSLIDQVDYLLQNTDSSHLELP